MSLARSTALLSAFLGLAALSVPVRAAPVAQDTGTATVSGGRPGGTWIVGPRRTRVLVNGSRDAGYLGVRVADVDSADVSRLDLPALRGARVTSVEDSSPAAQAGLRADDVIVDLDGEPVRSVSTLTRMVRETPPGRSVRLSVVRGGKTRQVTVVTGEAPGFESFGAMVAPNVQLRMERLVNDSTRERIREEVEKAHEEARKAGEEMRRSWRSGDFGPHAFMFELGVPGRLGVSLRPLGDQLGAYFGVKDGHGALIGSVESGSAAEKAGLKAGDVIVEVGGEKVEDPGDVIEAIQDADAGPLTVKVMRDRKEKTVTVDLPEHRRPAPGEETSWRIPAPPLSVPSLPMAPPEVHVAPPALPPLAPMPAAPAAPPVDRYI